MITTAIVYDHRGRAGKNQLGNVEIRITIDRKPYYIVTGIKIYRHEWLAGQIVGRPDVDELNDLLWLMIKKVKGRMNDMIRAGKPIDISELRRSIYEITAHGEPAFLDWLHEQIENMTLKESTIKHYRTLESRLRMFNTIRSWDDVTVENICKFDHWLHQQPVDNAERPGQVLADAGVFAYHKCLKKLLYTAEKFGKIDWNPYTKLRGEFSQGEKESVDYLTEEEIDRIIALDYKPGSLLAHARDLFIFQCFTGMAYCDMMSFDITNYRNVDGRWIANSERVKTGVAFVAHLLPPVVSVLERYNMALPRMTNQVYNRTLKTIQQDANITVKLHSHLGRHTFATYMLSHGVKVENLQRMLGHKEIAMTQRYAKTLAQSVHDEFDMIEKQLQEKGNS